MKKRIYVYVYIHEYTYIIHTKKKGRKGMEGEREGRRGGRERKRERMRILFQAAPNRKFSRIQLR